MSAKPETVFYTSVHRHLPSKTRPHREKMANPYRGGTADHWYDGDKADLWVEWKFIALPKRDTTVIDLVGGSRPALSPLQQDWLRERLRNGRSAWVIVGSKEGGVIFVDDGWERPFTAGHFRHAMLSRQQLAHAIARHTLLEP